MHPNSESYRRLFHMFQNTVILVNVFQPVPELYQRRKDNSLKGWEKSIGGKKTNLSLLEFDEESQIDFKIMTILL